MQRIDQSFLLQIVSDGENVTIANVGSAGGHEPQGHATANAKLCPGDKFDLDTGVRLATARALRKLADQMEPEV